MALTNGVSLMDSEVTQEVRYLDTEAAWVVESAWDRCWPVMVGVFLGSLAAGLILYGAFNWWLSA